MKDGLGLFDYELHENKAFPKASFIQLCLKSLAGATHDGYLLLSHTLITDTEIDEYVRQLKRDLDVVATQAKEALLKAKN